MKFAIDRNAMHVDSLKMEITGNLEELQMD